MKHVILALLGFLTAHSLKAKEIVVGVDFIPQKTMAVIFTPLVIPDLVSLKAAFEYRLHPKVNLVIPLEAKYMNYRQLIKWFAKGSASGEDWPKDWYADHHQVRPRWNFDYSHFKISTGFGAKFFPFGESMQSAFFIKTLFLIGGERFNAFSAEGLREGLVLSHVFTIGYNWVVNNAFTWGFELGEEFDYHTNPINKLPRFWRGFSPVLQLSLGFTI